MQGDLLLYGLITGCLFGLLGAGGSICIWPLLVLVMGHPEKIALVESLGIVGGIAAGGVIPYMWHKQIDYRALLLMGCSGALGASMGAWIGTITSDHIHRMVFIGIIFLAAWNMLHGPKQSALSDERRTQYKVRAFLVCVVGFLVGVCSGFSSIGGGFLLVPALVLFCHLPMHRAIGSSLALIVCNTFTGLATVFVSDRALFDQLDYNLIALYTCFGMLGSFFGAQYAQSIPQKRLRVLFGCMLMMIGCVLSYDFFSVK